MSSDIAAGREGRGPGERDSFFELPGRGEHVLARAGRATESAWHRIAAGWGLLTAEEADGVLRSTGLGGAPLDEHRERGRLLAAFRGGEYLYPAFQFDRRSGEVLPWVAPLIQLAEQRAWSLESVIVWMTSPTTYLGNGRNRPVDHLDDSGLILRTARNAFDNEW